MAAKITAIEEDTAPRTVEQLQGSTPAAVHQGAMAMAGWHSGKAVTPGAYAKVVTAFLKSGAGKGGSSC